MVEGHGGVNPSISWWPDQKPQSIKGRASKRCGQLEEQSLVRIEWTKMGGSLKCGWHHSMAWGPGLFRKKEVCWAPEFFSLLPDGGYNVTRSLLFPSLWPSTWWSTPSNWVKVHPPLVCVSVNHFVTESTREVTTTSSGQLSSESFPHLSMVNYESLLQKTMNQQWLDSNSFLLEN